MKSNTSRQPKAGVRRVFIPGIVLLSTSLLAIAPIAPANAEPRGGADSSTDAFAASVGVEFLKNQQILQEFQGWIITQPGAGDSGYIGQINDSSTLSVRLLWHDDEAFLKQVLDRAAGLGITATVENRSKSLKQLDDDARRLFGDKQKYQDSGFSITSIGTVGEVDGLTVNGTFSDELSSTANNKLPASAIQASRQALADSMAATVGDTVTLVESASGNASVNIRSNSMSPFFAGSYMYDRITGAGCSTGFAVQYNNRTWATTARHCQGTFVSRDNANTTIGSNSLFTSDGAASLLTGNGDGHMFDGAHNNSSGYAKPVWGLADLGMDDYICTSGGNSGVHCNLHVTNLRVWFNDGSGLTSMIEAFQKTPGDIAIMHGDSGGPVLVVYANGYVGAAGMIQSVQGTGLSGAACGLARDPSPCSTGVLFTSMRTIVNSIGGTIVTGSGTYGSG
ncbi:MAG: S1 family peptidase [Propionibacteriaceae bacterium]|nr:S1 family peptidase [Propionibacteriaceae bacterium]